MSNKLTITIENIPEEAFAELWKDNIKDAREVLGVPVQRTDSITIDFETLYESYPENSRLPELLTDALYCNSIMTAHKILNEQ